MATTYRIEGESVWGTDFGQNLQRMIKDKNITQSELADEIGVSRQIFSRYIHGDAIPSVYKACQIAKVLECDITDLIKFEYKE